MSTLSRVDRHAGTRASWSGLTSCLPIEIPPAADDIFSMSTPSDRRPVRRCPTCAKPTVERYRPFCSKRCADVDLNRWLTGRYAVAVVEEDASAQSDGPDAPDEHG